MERTFSQAQLEAIAQALGDTSDGLTGGEIGHLLTTLRMSDPTPLMTKWKRLLNALAERQNHSRNRRATLEFIRQAMSPARFARDPARFEPMRAKLNVALAFAGLTVEPSGKLSEVNAVQTLSEATRRARELSADLGSRGVHPDVLRFCREELVMDNYFHAVLEATKSIADKLRARSGLTENGGALVDHTLCGETPKISINAMITESQKSEQKGFANLVKGTFGMFRNTTAHEARLNWAMTKEDAEDLLSLASMIHRRLDASTVRT